MKKLAKKLSILCMLLVACLTLGVVTGCDRVNGIVGGLTSAVEDAFHECDYVEIMHDKDNHWNECDCGEKDDVEKHLFSETVNKQATCTEAGEKEFTCSCGYSYKEEIPANGHTLKDVEGKEATCTENGYTAYKACENCDYIEGKTEILASHNLEQVEAKAPTCTEDGYTVHKACTECNYTEGKEVLPAHHTLVDVEALAPTCTTDGYTAHKDCTECDYTEGKEVIPASHTLVDVAGQAATCTEDGYTAYKDCTECDYVEGKVVLDALGHALKDVEGKAATCTEDGYTAYKDCTECDYIQGKDVLEATGHTLQDKAGQEPTCAEEGYTNYKACENCDYTEDKEAIEKLPHTNENDDLLCDECSAYLLPEVGQAFKFVLEQKKLGKTLYFAGAMNGYYYATTELLCEATDLYLETAEGGYYIYFMNGETKNYLYIVASGNYTNVKIGETKDVWTYDELLGAFVNDVNGTDFYIGTFNTYNTISASKYSFIAGDKASTIGVSNFVVRPLIDNHTCEEVVDEGKAATCTATGLTDGSHCGICGKVIVAQEEIPMAEHSYTYGTCTVCGHEHGTVELKPVEVTISFADKANRTTFTTEQQVWEQNGIKVTNDKAESTSNVGDYVKPARFYKSSALKIEYKNMTKIVIDCVGLDAKYVDPYKAITGATVTVADGLVTVIFENPVDVLEIASLSAQARAYNITVTALQATSADAHTLVKTDAKAATCTEAGNSEYWTCSVCKKYFSDAEGVNAMVENAWVIAATGHTEVEHEAQAATCTEIGWNAYVTCSECDYTTYVEIPALGHKLTATAATAVTCTENGNSAYWTCSVCGKYFSDAEGTTEIEENAWVIGATGHNFEWKVDVEATFETTGIKHEECTACGVKQNENTVIPVKTCEHSFTATAATAATCTEAGNSAYWTCSVCERYYADAEGTTEIEENAWVIPAIDHTEEVLPAVAATCTETGLTEGKKCSVCEATLVEQTVVEKKGHTEEVVPAVAATCTETGLTEGKKCSVCEATLVEQEEIEATGHTEEVVAGKAATCTATGLTEGKKCSVCEAVLLAQETIPALDHTYVEYVCSACGKDDPTHYFVMSIAEALAAKDGKKVQISGTVAQINTAWSDSYGNITVTIVDEVGKEMYVYRLKTNVVLGDIITVKGVMATYNENRQIAAGATATIDGHDSSYDYNEMTIAEAIAAEDGTNVIVTGTVVKIGTAYSSSYNNISVYIADDEGTQLYLYRLTGEVALNEIIKVKGTMDTYSGARQVAGGTFEKVGTHTCSKYTEATCQKSAACVVCGTAKDDVLGDHNMVDGTCTVCGYTEGGVAPVTEAKAIYASEGVLSDDLYSISWTAENFTVTNNKGSTAIRTSDTSYFRAYQGSKLVISGNNGNKLTKIVVTCTSADYATVLANSVGGEASADGTVVTITLDGTLSEVTYTMSAQMRLNKVEVTTIASSSTDSETPAEYTATVTKADGTKVSLTFTEATMAEVEAEIEALLPANTAEYTYAWDKEVVLTAANCEFTIIETKVEVEEPGTSTETLVLEITKEDFTTTSYADNNKAHEENGYSYTTNQVMQQNSTMQWQKNKGTLTITGTFTKIEIVSTAGTFTLTLDNVAQVGTDGVYDFETAQTGTFVIKVGSATGKITSIKFYA